MKKGEYLPRITRVCPCGKEFKIRKRRLDEGRGKFCSQECKYKYREMPKERAPYKIVVVNKGWIKKGKEPWNKGRTDLPRPINFKNEDVGYHALHDWVKRHYGKAKKCEHCKIETEKIEWANRSHEYKRNIKDWIQLCRKCHIKYDRKKGWGIATKKFHLRGRIRKQHFV